MKTNKLKSLALFLMLLFSTSSFGYVGFGNYMTSVGKFQKDSDGNTRYFGINPTFFANTMIPTFFEQMFMPEVGFVYHLGLEPEYNKYTIYLLYDLGWQFNPRTFLRYGIGNVITIVSGSGGSEYLPDGNGTQEFFRPNTSSSSFNTSLNLGLEHFFWTSASLRIETLFTSILDSKSREMNILTGVNFHW